MKIKNLSEPFINKKRTFKDLFRIMKTCLFFLFVFAFQLTAINISAQDAIIELKKNSLTVGQLINEIEKQTDYLVVYSNREVNISRTTNLRTKSGKVSEYLNQTFQNTDIGFDFENNYIVLSKKTQQNSATIALLIQTGQQQNRTVRGRVTDSEGEPIIGVTIIVKDNPTQGTITDIEGNFTIANLSENAVLQFTYVGMIPQEINTFNKNTINVVMEADVELLNELVVIGYGTVPKRDLTGAVSSLKANDLKSAAQTQIDQYIQGRIPGVQVTQISSDPGAGYSIRIRGANSITANNEPLYVIDGFPGAPLNALNPGDIESIEVLKDASSAAIYGSRGANGVILITTKKGQKGDLKIEYDGYIGIQNAAKKLDLLNGSEYMTFLNEINIDKGLSPLYSQSEIEDVGQGTDWQDAILRNAPIQNHQLTLSAGSEKNQYYTSLGYVKQEGIIKNSGIERFSLRLNTTQSINNLTIGVNLNASLVKDKYILKGGGINIEAGVVSSAVQIDPVMTIYDDNGNLNNSTALDLNNPLALATTIHNNNETDRIFGNAYAEYRFKRDFSAKLNFGADRRSSRDDRYITDQTKRGANVNGKATINSPRGSSFLSELTLSYNNNFNDIHSVNSVIGTSYQKFDNNSFGTSSQDFLTDAFLTDNLEAGNPLKVFNWSSRSRSQLLSFLARVNYSFLNKYLLTFSFRRDGSSKFGANYKYGNFPSLALAWKLDEENFLKQYKFLSQLKLRSSFGTIGNQEIGTYNSLLLLGTSGEAVYGGERFASIVPIQLGNPELRWETTRQFDIGLDFGFFKNRIEGSFDYFHKNTYDLLLALPVPTTSGFENSLQNVGDTKNVGVEFIVTSRNLIDTFNWSTTFNISTIKNKVTNLGTLSDIKQGSIRFLNDFSIITVGQPINSYYGYKVEGIFQNDDEIAESAQTNAQPGDIRFKNINNDDRIDAQDRTILGNPFPDFSFGLSNDFSYKGFGLSVFMDGMYGNELLNFTKIDSEYPMEFGRNRQSYVLDRWTENNKNSVNPSYINSDVSKAVNSRVVEDASYLRLKYIRLNYDFPNLKSEIVSSFSLYFAVQNLLTFTNYSGFNPDVSLYGGSNLKVDYDSTPLNRIYTLGFNIKF